MLKIALLIPSTSKNRNWKSFKESYLYKHTLKTLLLTYDAEHEYKVYVAIDRGDPVYDSIESKEGFIRFVSVMKNIKIGFYYNDNIPKGHVTKMWNMLFGIAHEENSDYFYQCGDDIEFKTKGWVNDSVKALKSSGNLGLTGPINNNSRILTQSFVSRRHMDLFGYYFPEEIINWFCDDWINEVYVGLKKFYPLVNHYCANVGGDPRYNINNVKHLSEEEFSISINKMRKKCSNLSTRDITRARLKIIE
jgi:hypothetical protein